MILNKKIKRGFTLIELLAVIVILVIAAPAKPPSTNGATNSPIILSS